MKDGYPFREFGIDWHAVSKILSFMDEDGHPYHSKISKTENYMLYLLALFNI